MQLGDGLFVPSAALLWPTVPIQSSPACVMTDALDVLLMGMHAEKYTDI